MGSITEKNIMVATVDIDKKIIQFLYYVELIYSSSINYFVVVI